MNPAAFESVEQLDDALSAPAPGVVETCGRLEGDVVVLGVAGKMGPTLARMIKRASAAAGVERRVIGVSRFSSGDMEGRLQAHGIETVRCDLLDETQVAKLPDAPNVVYMPAMKFGATGAESLTWAMNTHLPTIACRRYRDSRIVAFSTGNVYGLSSVEGGGSIETDKPNPVGEYAMSCLGRERMFEHFSRTWDIPVAIIRLNYACEPRYGVLVDIAQKVWNDEPVDVSMGFFNIIWQGDANAMTIQAFDHAASPPRFFNVTGPERLSIRDTALKFGELLEREVKLAGEETDTALLSDSSCALKLFGGPRVEVGALMNWIADWIRRGGENLGKPTKFESRDGKF